MTGDTPARGRLQAGPRLRATYEGAEMVVAGELDMCTAAVLRALLAGRPAPAEGYRLDLTRLTYIDGHGARVLFEIAPLWMRVRVSEGSAVAHALRAMGLAAVTAIEYPADDPRGSGPSACD